MMSFALSTPPRATRPNPRVRPLGWVLGSFCALLLALCAGQAQAHAVLLDRQPAEGAQLSVAPARLELRFDEAVTPVSLRLIDAAGHLRAGPDGAVAEDDTLRLALPALEAGHYIVSYRVISADSHPIGGSYVFSVGEVAAAAPIQQANSDAPLAWTSASVLLRSVLLAVTLTLAGLTFWPTRPAQRRLATRAAGVAAVLLAISIGVEGGLAIATPSVALFDAAVWRVGVQSAWLATVIAGLISLGLLALGLNRSWRWLAVVGGVAVAASHLLSGHVVSAPPVWLSRPALLLHLLCAAAWIGALPLLRQVLADTPTDAAARILRRFSRSGIGLVAGLVASGLAMTLVQAGSISFLIFSRYGVILLAKLVLVAGAVLLAVRNRTRLLPRLEGAEQEAVTALRRAISAQIALIAGAFVLTALLGAQVPPRSLAAEAEYARQHTHSTRQTVMAHLSNQAVMLMLSLTPNGDDIYAAEVSAWDAKGNEFLPLGVTLRLSRPAQGVEPITREFTATDGALPAQDVVLPIGGEWQVEASVLLTEFTETTLHGVIQLHGEAP